VTADGSSSTSPNRSTPTVGHDGRGSSEAGDGAGCLAVAWFDAALLAGTLALMWPIASLAALGCPSGGPGCGPGLAVLSLLGTAVGIGAAFTAIVMGLAWLGRRWLVGIVLLAGSGIALLSIPSVVLIRTVAVGDAWLTLVITAGWLIVPGLSILADARGLARRRGRSARPA
jgi:hypothetical protein